MSELQQNYKLFPFFLSPQLFRSLVPFEHQGRDLIAVLSGHATLLRNGLLGITLGASP